MLSKPAQKRERISQKINNLAAGFGFRDRSGVRPSKSSESSGSKIKLALVVLFLLVGILLLGKFFSFGRALFSPWGESSTNKNYIWNKDFNLNLLLFNKNVSVLSYNPMTKNVTLYHIPNETYLNVAHGFGSWQLGSVFELGESSKLGGSTLLKDTLISFLGMPLDGYIQFNNTFTNKDSKAVLEYLKSGPLNIFGLLSNSKTNLTLLELIKLKFDLSQVRFDKIKIINLGETNVLEKENLADGTYVLASDVARLDNLLLPDIQESKIKDEALTIAVFNATNHPLLAQKVGRVITNIGGNVIITANSEQKLESTIILGDDSATITRIRQIFNTKCLAHGKCDKIEPGQFGLSSTRAQINVIVGEDFYQKL